MYNFLTFGTSLILGSKARLKFRAIECGWFDNVYSINENDITDSDFILMKNKYWNLDYHGFYFWKIFAILLIYNKINDSDILVYTDSGSDINLNGKQYFLLKVNKLVNNNLSILAYGMTTIGMFSSSIIIKKVLNEINDDILNYPQIQAGLLYLIKNENTTKILNEWKNITIKHYRDLCMEYKEIKDPENNMFIQNRNDQTCIGLLAYKYKNYILLLKPDLDFLCPLNIKTNLEFRLTKHDIIITRKKFNFKPFVRFNVGHILPQYLKYFDSYTHFIDVGNNNLDRCTSTNKDNIGDINDLAELTAMYYIWKNIDLSDVKYICFETYRKPFYQNNKNMYNFLEKNHCDCIANKYYQNRYQCHLTSVTKLNIEDFRNWVKEIYPEDYLGFCKHQLAGYIYPCNSFVMKVSDFYKLCEYIFPVLIPYAKKHLGLCGTTKHSPLAGVFAEDLTSFFISKTFKNIRSEPFLVYPYYKRCFLVNIPGNYPVLFGSFINEHQQLMFYPFGELPLCKPMINFNFKKQIQGKSDDLFYYRNEQPQQKEIFNSKCYLVK